MKTRNTITLIGLLFLLSAFIPKVQTEANLWLEGMYYKVLSDDEIAYDRIVKYEGKYYEIKGSIAFDNEGVTMQKLVSKKELKPAKMDKRKAEIAAGNFIDGAGEFPKVLFVQFSGDEKALVKRLNISSDIENLLLRENLGTSFGVDLLDGAANMEFEVKDWNKSLEIIFQILDKYQVTEQCLIGRRVYPGNDDYNVEIFYPVDYSGSFRAF
jgi:hypothetical protein